MRIRRNSVELRLLGGRGDANPLTRQETWPILQNPGESPQKEFPKEIPAQALKIVSGLLGPAFDPQKKSS
jgi:hypothetical protein